jgi:hypothetical protein
MTSEPHDDYISRLASRLAEDFHRDVIYTSGGETAIHKPNPHGEDPVYTVTKVVRESGLSDAEIQELRVKHRARFETDEGRTAHAAELKASAAGSGHEAAAKRAWEKQFDAAIRKHEAEFPRDAPAIDPVTEQRRRNRREFKKTGSIPAAKKKGWI